VPLLVVHLAHRLNTCLLQVVELVVLQIASPMVVVELVVTDARSLVKVRVAIARLKVLYSYNLEQTTLSQSELVALELLKQAEQTQSLVPLLRLVAVKAVPQTLKMVLMAVLAVELLMQEALLVAALLVKDLMVVLETAQQVVLLVVVAVVELDKSAELQMPQTQVMVVME
jgi:hypothetical protein